MPEFSLTAWPSGEDGRALVTDCGEVPYLEHGDDEVVEGRVFEQALSRFRQRGTRGVGDDL